jgi:hypothetical protein
MFARSRNKTKVMVIAPGVSLPQYGEVAAFLFSFRCCLFSVFIFFIVCTDRTGQPILTRHASIDEVSPKELPFGDTMTINFIKGPIPPPKKNRTGLAGSRKTQERFRVYLHRGSIDKHQVYLKLRDLRPGRILFTNKFGGKCATDSNSKKIPAQ